MTLYSVIGDVCKIAPNAANGAFTLRTTLYNHVYTGWAKKSEPQMLYT